MYKVPSTWNQVQEGKPNCGTKKRAEPKQVRTGKEVRSSSASRETLEATMVPVDYRSPVSKQKYEAQLGQLPFDARGSKVVRDGKFPGKFDSGSLPKTYSYDSIQMLQ